MNDFNNNYNYGNNEPAQDMEKAYEYSSPRYTHGNNYYTPPINNYNQPPEPEKRKQKKKNRPVTTRSLAIAMCLCVLVSGAAGFGGGYLASKNKKAETKTSDTVLYQTVSQSGKGSAANGSMTVADVVANASQSVVEIRTESVTMGSFMGQYVSEGAGSGVIISKDGYIVTNHHVIDNATKITVRTKSGDSYNAALVGSDEKTDLAVIKINETNLKPAVFGDSDKLVVGETAIAVGNPLGELGGTVTSGIISALDREIQMDKATMTLLQFDAAINPGNSGGGLFNASGELIGVVNAKSSGSGIEGLGFAIPGNSAKEVASQLIQYGYVKGRVDLGFTAIDLTNTKNAMMYRVSETGIYIKNVSNQQSGLRSGDKIVKINGKEINTADDFNKSTARLKVNDTLTITVKRNGQTQDISYKLGEENPNAYSSLFN